MVGRTGIRGRAIEGESAIQKEWYRKGGRLHVPEPDAEVVAVAGRGRK